MVRKPCCSREGLNRGAWTPLEDKILMDYIKAHGEGKWRNLPKKAGLKRCGKSCRLRWLNYLRPDIKRGNITQDEEDLIIRLHKLLGNRWSLIAGRLPGRTDNEIKNYWNTNIGKRLQEGTIASGQCSRTSLAKPAKSSPVTQQTKNNQEHHTVPQDSLHLPPSSSSFSVVHTKALRCTKVIIPQSTDKNDKFMLEELAITENATPVLASTLSSSLSEQQPAVSGSPPTTLSGSEHDNNFDFMFCLDMADPFLSELLNAADICESLKTTGDEVGYNSNKNEKERSYFLANSSQTAFFSDEAHHNDLELWLNGFSS